MFRELPPLARWYVAAVVLLGALTFVWLIPRASFSPVLPLLFLVLLSSFASAFKIQFPIAGGSNMSVSYVIDIAALILRGPHATMIVGAASGWSQSTFNARTPNPAYRTLFNMAVLVLTVQAAGQVYQRLGGTRVPEAATMAVPLAGMALTYFFVNTIPIAVAIALTTGQNAWQVWKRDFSPNAASYLLGAVTAAVAIAITETSGYWLMLLLAAAPLYLTYKIYRSGVQSEARQGAILEAAHDAIVTMDAQLNIREFNPAAERMFGVARQAVLGRSAGVLLPAGDRAARIDDFARYARTGEGPLAGRQIEMSGIRSDGTEFPAEVTVSRLAGEHAITAFVRDVTERRLLEEQLRQSQKLEAIGRLAGGVAHDFNNILMSIMGSAELLLVQLPEGDPARGEAGEIKRSVLRGAGLTRQLLAFSRRQVSSARRFDLNEVVAAMETMLRRLIGPEIEFAIVRSPRPVPVVADPAQFEQVVLNLVINSRDAMPGGGRLTVAVDEVQLDGSLAAGRADGVAGPCARLSVSDTGTGIDEQARAKLFEPFFTTKEQGKGTGLGLSIVYGIVRQSGGEISVTSEPGRGATFVIHLPLAEAGELTPTRG